MIKSSHKEKREMKFVHIADMHFDSPFTGLNVIENLSHVRRLEQRKIFKKVIDYCKENEVDYLFIAGDLYEHEYVRKSTIEYIDGLFAEIPNTKVLITPGNHDPYVKGSYYETFWWSKNVYICKKNFEILEEPEVIFYMTAFTDFQMENSPIEQMMIKNTNKLNVLLTHCDLNGSKGENGFVYNPILESKLKALKCDYVALGHIHKTNFGENENIIYPGSPISFGFDEPGDHGMVIGELNQFGLKTKFVKLDERRFEKYDFSVDDIASLEELVEQISELELDENNLYEIVLCGNRQFDIRAREVLKLINHRNVLKVKDETEFGFSIEEIAKESNLRGIFVREVIKKYQEGMYTEEQIKKAIEIGLNAM